MQTHTGSRIRSGRRAGLYLQSGLSLIELITSLLIVAVLMRVAVPSFNSVIRDNRLLSGGNGIMGAIAFARSEAVRRGRLVTVCPTSDGKVCGSDWAAGWMVYVEGPDVAVGTAPPADVTVAPSIFLQQGEAMKKVAVTRSTGTKNYIRFSSRGQSEEAIAIDVKPSTGCTSGKVSFRRVAVGIAGRPAMTSKICP